MLGKAVAEGPESSTEAVDKPVGAFRSGSASRVAVRLFFLSLIF